MGSPNDPRSARIARALIAAASMLVPQPRRGAWREEWSSEIWHLVQRGEQRGAVNMGSGVGLVGRCLGAFPHALWLRAEEWAMDMMLQDIRYAFRTLSKRPLFTFVVVATLAVGVGGSTAIFSLVNSVLLRPLPMPDSDRLVWMWGTVNDGRPTARVSPPDFLDFRSGSTVYEELGAFTSGRATLTGGERAVEISRAFATANFLEVLGFEPVLGRTFNADEEVVAGGVAMISEDLWRTRFGGDPEVLGRSLTVDGEVLTVVGILPAGLPFPQSTDVWLPLTVSRPEWNARGAHFFRVVGRLRSGVSVIEAQAELDVISRRLEGEYPETNAGFYAHLQPLHEVIVGGVRPALMVLLGAVGLVLLIACGNVANLLLARSIGRRGEIALRSAVGASRLRVLRQLVTESLTLALLGGGVGLGLAYGAVAFVQRVQPQNLPRAAEVAVDGTVLVFALVLSTVVGLLFGLAPALKLSRANLLDDLQAVRSDRGASGARLRGALVSLQVAVSLVLLVGASLLVKSLNQLQAVDPGLEAAGVLTVPVSFPEGKFATNQEMLVALDEMITRMEGLPGIEAASAISLLPFSGSFGDTYVYREGRQPERIQDIENTALVYEALDGYFETMGISLMRGRGFRSSDDAGEEAVLVTVISQSLADRLWPTDDPVGQRLVVWSNSFEVIGVAQDVRHGGLADRIGPAFYVSERQTASRDMYLVIKAPVDVASVMDPVREAIWSVDRDQTLERLSPMDGLVAGSTAQSRFQTVLLGSFAGVAILLAAMGVYGVLAYSVSQRRQELGVRMAMGAGRAAVARLVLRSGLLLSGWGIGLGLVGAFWLTRLMGGILFQVEPDDPFSFVAAAAIMVVVAILSSYLPARRASLVNPIVALRDDTV